jgi:hypothetical protein
MGRKRLVDYLDTSQEHESNQKNQFKENRAVVVLLS